MPRIAPLLAALACLLPLQCLPADVAGDDRTAIYDQYRKAFDAGDYQQALPLAIRVVELTSNQFGSEAIELVNPLTNVATTLYRMQQHTEALDAYRRALTLLDFEGNPSDPRLVAPLHGLGATLRGLERDEEAIVPLKRAVDIIRNRDGLHAPAQLPILKALIAAYEKTGRNEDAGREHQYAYSVAEQAWGADDPRMIPVLVELAGWHEKTGRYSTSRLLYMKAVQVADKETPSSVKAVEPLRGIARTYRLAFVHGEPQELQLQAADELPESLRRGALSGMVNTASGDGERALRDALRRLEPSGAGKAAERGAVLVDLGDWYRIAGAGQRAMTAWREAWDALNLAGDTSLLAQPEAVIYRAPPVATSQRTQDPEEYRIEEVQLRAYVSADGALREVTVANPAPARESAERAVVAALRRAVWRPAFAGGLPVAATGYIFREQVYVRIPGEESSAD
jgi:tetratricopeptide (TPR) repeat protein